MRSNESHFPGKQITLAFLLSIITPGEVHIWMDEWTDRGRDRRKMSRGESKKAHMDEQTRKPYFER